MRIAQVAPLYESVPPKYYGGTERVVSYLTEELVRLGEDVTLFASGDSQTSAKLVSPCARSLRLDTACVDQLSHHILMLEQVAAMAEAFDLIHFHIDYLHYPLSRRSSYAQLTTLHGRLDLPDLAPLYREFTDMPLISISDAQRTPLPMARWVGTVHHGLPAALYRPGDGRGGYLAFIGRISPEKGVADAIDIAQKAGVPLKIAAKVDDNHWDYFHKVIEPLLAQPGIEYVGEIGEQDKGAFLGHAAALLFFIDWPEPFGLAMIEAMACGTPVIARRRGSVPELIEAGVTGLLCETPSDAIAAVRRVGRLDRQRVRAEFESRFTVERMARDYLQHYQRVIDAYALEPGDAAR